MQAPGPGHLCPLSWSLSSHSQARAGNPLARAGGWAESRPVTHAGGQGDAHRPSVLIANPLCPQATSQRDKWLIEADLGTGWLGSRSGWGDFILQESNTRLGGGAVAASTPALPVPSHAKHSVPKTLGQDLPKRQDLRYRSHPVAWEPPWTKGHRRWHRTSLTSWWIGNGVENASPQGASCAFWPLPSSPGHGAFFFFFF